jgi:hypothetical protein
VGPQHGDEGIDSILSIPLFVYVFSIRLLLTLQIMMKAFISWSGEKIV